MSDLDNRGSKAQRILYLLAKSLYPYYTVVYEQQIPSLNQRFDIFVKELGIAIEYDGDQHNRFVEHFHKDINGYLKSGMLDKYKNAFANANGIKLVRISGNVSELTKNDLFKLIEEIPFPDAFYSFCCLEKPEIAPSAFKERFKQKRKEAYREMKNRAKQRSKKDTLD